MPDYDLQSVLIDAGLLPNAALSNDRHLTDGFEIYLRELESRWRSASDSRSAKTAAWLATCQSNGARLTLGAPSISSDCNRRWLGQRLLWWPHGIPSGERIGLASSRLGRNLESRGDWFRMLRAACLRANPLGEVLVTAASTATSRFVERSSTLFGLRQLRVEIATDASLAGWTEHLRRRPIHDEVVLSPPFGSDSGSEEFSSLPLQDRAVAALSDRLVVFHVRRGGHWDRLIRLRLRDEAWPAAHVYVGLGPDLLDRHLADELTGLGAIGWLILDDHAATDSVLDEGQEDTLASIVSPPPSQDWPYLTHCTRRRHGPWPSQQQNDFLDELIMRRPDADRSAFAVLQRIVRSERLVATSDLIRGDTAAVSFTSVPLADLPKLRVYRQHQVRWDFEPYGICIRREWLEQFGTRPVVYGDEQTWKDLPLAQRAFFQLQRGERSSVDWSNEQEWRHVGDVQLEHLPAEAALLFVPTEAEAKKLALISRWPITVVG